MARASSVEWQFISVVLAQGDLMPALLAGISVEHFTDERYRAMWDWIVSYYKRHNSCPDKDAFLREFADVDSFASTKRVKYEAVAEELTRGLQRRKLTSALNHLVDIVDDPEAALAFMSATLSEVGFSGSALHDFDLIELWQDRVAEYREKAERPTHLRKGAIPTGFTGLDIATNGLLPGQLITLTGEPKAGKTQTMLIMARAAHRYGRVPYVVSFEMSYAELSARNDGIEAGVDYNDLLSGRAPAKTVIDRTTKKEKVVTAVDYLEEVLRKRRHMHPFIVSQDASSSSTITALKAKIMQHQPGIVFVDGVYMMRDEEGEPNGSPQAITHITRSMKRLAQELRVPIVQTTQVLAWKLGSKKDRKITADAIGYSSSFVQDSDLVLGVERKADEDNVTILRTVLGRMAPANRTVEIQWDWKHSNFEELEGGGYSERDFLG